MAKKKKKIIDKIKINQSIVKNQNKTPKQRQVAYLELKRLKETGNILMMPDVYMPNMNYKKNDIHNYFVFSTDEKNNSKVNLITHSKKGSKSKIDSLSNERKTNLRLKINFINRKGKLLKYYNFYESKYNDILTLDEINRLSSDIYNYNYNYK